MTSPVRRITTCGGGCVKVTSVVDGFLFDSGEEEDENRHRKVEHGLL
jgi:hypothetical protein